jgi:hypothetical protein
MAEATPPARVLKITAIAALVVALLGLLADVTGLLSFITGKDLPELLHPSQPSATSPATGGAAAPGSTPDPADQSSPGTVPSPATTTTAVAQDRPVPPPAPATTTDAVKNFQLSLGPPEFDAATPRVITIETSDGGLGTYVDIEIADPSAQGGACPTITAGPCNLIYSGGAEADRNGYARLDFEWFGNAPGHDNIHHPGTYTVTVQDRGTGSTVSLDFVAR